ncbi:MAG: hypothetical protein ACYSUI_19320 [Planctomycetota bacterium]|jgi:hypothetical protein
MKPTLVRSVAVCTILVLAGCNWLVPTIFLHPGTKKVSAEFSKLQDKTVAVVVYAAQDTLFDYPHIRLELSSFIGDKIRAEVDGVHVIDARKVEHFVEQTAEAAYSPRMVGDHFEADMVVYVELLEFQIRDPDAPDFLQGRVQASVGVHDLTTDADEVQYQELQPVAATHPDRPAVFTPTGALVVRNDTYAKFSEAVARKFYDHEEEL